MNYAKILNKNIKKAHKITIDNITIKNNNYMTVLGTVNNDRLNWDNNMLYGIISIQLRTRIYTLSKTTKYLPTSIL